MIACRIHGYQTQVFRHFLALTLLLVASLSSGCAPDRTCEETFSCPEDSDASGTTVHIDAGMGGSSGRGTSGMGGQSAEPAEPPAPGAMNEAGNATGGMGGSEVGPDGGSIGGAGTGGSMNPNPPLSDNANLSGLTVDPGYMLPAFDVDTENYESSMPILSEEVAVTATVADDAAVLRINGVEGESGVPRQLSMPDMGPLTVQVEVEAESGATRQYSVAIDRQDIAYFKASNPVGFDEFGTSVAFDGDTLAVGAHFDAGRGAVYVFHRSAGMWDLQDVLRAPNADSGDQFGEAVALDGDTLVVGANHEGSDATGINGDMLNNDRPGSGAVYVFERSNGRWSDRPTYIKSLDPDASADFGRNLSTKGDMLVVWSSSGVAHVFRRSSGQWAEQTLPDFPASATTVAAGVGRVAVGSGGDVHVFRYSNNAWGREDVLELGGAVVSSVALDGNTLVAGVPGAGTGGTAYVFELNGVEWQERAQLTPTVAASSAQDFGGSVSVSGSSIAVGSKNEDSAARGVNGVLSGDAEDSGAVYVFRRMGTNWSFFAHVKAPNADSDDKFGSSVSLSGDELAVGAPLEASSGGWLSPNQSSNSSFAAGAAYIF